MFGCGSLCQRFGYYTRRTGHREAAKAECIAIFNKRSSLFRGHLSIFHVNFLASLEIINYLCGANLRNFGETDKYFSRNYGYPIFFGPFWSTNKAKETPHIVSGQLMQIKKAS
jgi:hypothetical protein